MSAGGLGADVGLHPDSKWNNPEPEIVLGQQQAQVLGATLGNDVNLRDIEGRSALLGKAKDNNGPAPSALHPPVRRAFQHRHRARRRGEHADRGRDDDFHWRQQPHARDQPRPAGPGRQVCGRHHQYPDGFMLFLGTMFSPIKDRDAAGGGFTHHLGDRVTISTPSLGALVNHAAQRCDCAVDLRRALLERAAAPSAATAARGAPEQVIYPSLAGKRVVITGGGSGIGAGIVEGFARQARRSPSSISPRRLAALQESLSELPAAPRSCTAT
jgi:fumarylacetoacetate (FAA) hydrolase family protein